MFEISILNLILNESSDYIIKNMKLLAIFAAVSTFADLPQDDHEFDYYSLMLTWP